MIKGNVTAVSLKFRRGTKNIAVEVEKDQGTSQQFETDMSSVSQLFRGSWNTGFLSVSEDGPIYIESKDGFIIVLIQRAAREKQELNWYKASENYRTNHKEVFRSPWAVLGVVLAPNAGGTGYRYYNGGIWVLNARPISLDAETFDARWLGNVYEEGAICWGTTNISNRAMTVASATNIANDFFNLDYTDHIHNTKRQWKAFHDGTLKLVKIGTIKDSIERLRGYIHG